MVHTLNDSSIYHVDCDIQVEMHPTSASACIDIRTWDSYTFASNPTSYQLPAAGRGPALDNG